MAGKPADGGKKHKKHKGALPSRFELGMVAALFAVVVD
jgi:hypothetical protein